MHEILPTRLGSWIDERASLTGTVASFHVQKQTSFLKGSDDAHRHLWLREASFVTSREMEVYAMLLRKLVALGVSCRKT